jgi:uncharacterized membrane protein
VSLFSTSACARPLVSERTWTILAAIVGFGFWALTSWIAIAEYVTYNSTSRDLAVYLQVIWNTGHGQPFATTILEHNRLHVAEHLAGLIPLLAPLYGLAPDPRWLFVLQQAVLSLAAIPVFLWTRRRLGAGWAALLTTCYLAMPTLTEVALDAFYPVVFTALPLAFAAYYALRSRPAWAFILSVLALPIEEEAALVGLGIGVFMATRNGLRRWGLLLSAVSLSWMVLAASVIMPRFHDPTTLSSAGNRTVGHYNLLRTNPAQLLSDLARRRLTLAGEWLLLPTGGVALAAPQVLVMAIPELGALLLADNEGRYRRHWVAPALPIIWLATASGLARFARPLHRQIVASLIVVGTSTSFIIDSSLPGGGDYEPFDTVWNDRAEQLQRALQEIPPNTPTAASRRALPYLANRSELYVYPPSYSGALWPVSPLPRYWVFDLTNDLTREHLESRSSPLRADGVGTVWTTGADVAFITPDAADLSRPAGISMDWGQLQSWDVRAGNQELELLLQWESIRRPSRAQVRMIRLLNTQGQEVRRVDSMPLDEMYPTNEWQRGQVWVDRNLLPASLAGNRVQVGSAERGRVPSNWHEIGRLSP